MSETPRLDSGSGLEPMKIQIFRPPPGLSLDDTDSEVLSECSRRVRSAFTSNSPSHLQPRFGWLSRRFLMFVGTFKPQVHGLMVLGMPGRQLHGLSDLLLQGSRRGWHREGIGISDQMDQILFS